MNPSIASPNCELRIANCGLEKRTGNPQFEIRNYWLVSREVGSHLTDLVDNDIIRWLY